MSETGRILIVDDDPAILWAHRHLLRKAGYTVIEAATGREGLQMVRQHRPELVLLDVVMPDLSGIEVCRQIKADHDLKDTFVILCSGLQTESEEQIEGLETGADGYIVRPIPNRELLARVEAMLRIKRAEESTKRLLHEFQVQQLELEMQNEELRLAKAELAESRDKYADLYDFAPVGYLTLDENGRILEGNLTAALQLGVQRGHLINSPFPKYIITEDADRFHLHLKEVFKSKERRNCEVQMPAKDGGDLYVLLDSIFVQDAHSKELCRTSVIDITDRKRTEDALRESEEHYRSLFDNMLNGFAYCSMLFEQDRPKDFTYLNVNSAFEALTGLKNVIGKRVSEVIPGIRESDPELLELYGRVASTGRPERFEIYIRALGMWFSISVYSPRKEHFVAVFDVVTERKQAEQALVRSEEMYRRLFEDAVLGIFQSTPDGKVIAVNPAYARMFGFDSPEEVKNLVDDVAVDLYLEPSRRNEIIHKIMDSKRPIRAENYYRRKDGSVFIGNLHAWSVRDNDGKILYLEGFIEDITERKQAEESIERLRRQNELILNSADEGIIGLDLEGKYTFVNPAAASMLGYEADELIGRTVHGLHRHTKKGGDPYPEEECPIHQAYRNGMFCPLTEEVYRRKDGTSFPVRYSTAPTIEDGKVLGSVVTFRDITEHKRAEEEKDRLKAQLAQAQKMEAIGTLAGGIAHDFNNILAIIMGFAEIADLNLPKDSPVKKSIGEVLKAARRATDLVRQILTLSRKSEQKRKPLHVIPIIDQAMRLLRATLPTTIEMHQEIGLPQGDDVVLADSTQIHQILMNLAANAAHAMREQGGILQVTLSSVDFGPGDLGKPEELSPGKYLKLSVEDTGHGMDRTTLDRIFDPYFTTKEPGEGTGLGLAVVHGILKSHEGAITVYSKPGEGTAFQIYLPRLESAATSEAEALTEIPRGNERILLVDDEEGLLDAGKQILEHLGYELTATTSSVEGLLLFRQQPDHFDLVITDQTMPQMTGIDLARKIMRNRSDIPIILCTGFSERINEEDARKMGISAFAMKPISLRDIAELIREVLKTRES